jgi:hypothetical protein
MASLRGSFQVGAGHVHESPAALGPTDILREIWSWPEANTLFFMRAGVLPPAGLADSGRFAHRVRFPGTITIGWCRRQLGMVMVMKVSHLRTDAAARATCSPVAAA